MTVMQLIQSDIDARNVELTNFIKYLEKLGAPIKFVGRFRKKLFKFSGYKKYAKFFDCDVIRWKLIGYKYFVGGGGFPKVSKEAKLIYVGDNDCTVLVFIPEAGKLTVYNDEYDLAGF